MFLSPGFSLSAFSSVVRFSLLMEIVVRSDGNKQVSSCCRCPAAVTAADLSICGQHMFGQENVILIYGLSEPHKLGDMDLVSNFKTLPKILCFSADKLGT